VPPDAARTPTVLTLRAARTQRRMAPYHTDTTSYGKYKISATQRRQLLGTPHHHSCSGNDRVYALEYPVNGIGAWNAGHNSEARSVNARLGNAEPMYVHRGHLGTDMAHVTVGDVTLSPVCVGPTRGTTRGMSIAPAVVAGAAALQTLLADFHSSRPGVASVLPEALQARARGRA
jgi:hypothetical protein